MEKFSISLRKAVRADVDMLSDLASQTFLEAYLPERPNLDEDFKIFINEHFSPLAVGQRILEPGTIFLIVEVNGRPGGYAEISLNKSPEEKFNEVWTCLDQIYLKTEMVGKGVGKVLMQESLNIAKQQGSKFVWLQVWEKNLRAQNFYKKWGFDFFGSIEFKFGHSVDIDLLMKKQLK